MLLLSSQNKMLSLCLCDTNTTKDIHINDILVEQGLALFTPDTDQDTRDVDGYQLEGTPVTVSVVSPWTIKIVGFLWPVSRANFDTMIACFNVAFFTALLYNVHACTVYCVLLSRGNAVAEFYSTHTPLTHPHTPTPHRVRTMCLE